MTFITGQKIKIYIHARILVMTNNLMPNKSHEYTDTRKPRDGQVQCDTDNRLPDSVWIDKNLALISHRAYQAESVHTIPINESARLLP